MKSIFKLSMSLTGLLLLMVWTVPSEAAVQLDKLKVDLGLQYRVMYNFSNITTKDDYDFFRQRFRLSLDVKPAENVGGYAQFEYRGGWGGTSPTFSDPRVPGITPDSDFAPAFSRLQARGIRYGYIYVSHMEEHILKAGILPLSDQVGDTLFSADWDFNVGGVAFMAKGEPVNYRLAYVRLLDDLRNLEDDQNGDLYVLDVNADLMTVELGGHVYYLSIDNDAAGLDKNTQGWYAATASAKVSMVDLNGFVLFNSGDNSESNDGVGVKVEGSALLGDLRLSVMGLLTTGDETPAKGFQTPEGIVGSSGYWAYSYIFTAHGPSDVNDFGLEIGNRGRGLRTVQAKLDIPVTDRLGAQIQVGWFQSSEDIIVSSVNKGSDLGTEFGGQIKYGVAKNLNLEVGAAFASLDDGAMALYQDLSDTNKEDSVKEVFARFQLEL